MTPTSQRTQTKGDVEEIVRKLGPNTGQVVRSLGSEFAPAPRSQSRQLTASVAMRHSHLVERQWRDGCAQCTYYRLTPLDLRVRDHLLFSKAEPFL
jgi:hypothetical protein